MTTSIHSDNPALLNKGAQQKLDAFERSIREQEDVIRRFDAYIDDVISGRILASKKVIAACKRHLRDMDKAANDPDYPWCFDAALAARPVRFMEKYLAPTKGAIDHMELLGWQIFVLCSIFGWVDKETRLRRFREALVLVGRGNGKSTLMAGLAAFMAAKDGERGADIYLLANSKEQASIVYKECRRQIIGSPSLRRRFRPTNAEIFYDKTNSTIQHRASDSERLDGLNPHCAIFDELHIYRDYLLINVVQLGMLKRKQPLAIYITTMGQVLDGPLMDFYALFTDALTDGLLSPDVADRLFFFGAELDKDDPIDDPDLWIKANPSMGVLLSKEDLIAAWNRKKLIPQQRADFINKQLNIMTDMADASWASIEIIDRCKDVIDPEVLKGLPCWAGYDLSMSDDLTAAVLLWPLPDGRVYIKQHSWVTRDYVVNDDGKTPFTHWQMLGKLDIVDDEIISKDVIYDWFLHQEEVGEDIQVIGYDPANAVRLNQQLTSHGWITEVVRQGALTLNDPMHEILEYMRQGRLVFDRDPMMRWYLNNVRLRNDPRRDAVTAVWMPTKRVRKRKIDGFMAMLDAWVVWVRAGIEPEVEPSVTVYTLEDLMQ